MQVCPNTPVPTHRDAIVLPGWSDVIRESTDALFLLAAMYLRRACEENTSLHYRVVEKHILDKYLHEHILLSEERHYKQESCSQMGVVG